jgi:glucose uptake protein GlcU
MVHITYAKYSVVRAVRRHYYLAPSWPLPIGVALSRVRAQFRKRDRKLEDRIMIDNLLTWVFWSGAAVAMYITISSSVRYVHHWRRGSKIMAAEAALQTVIYLSCLVTLWCVYRAYTLE